MWCPSCGSEYRPGFTHCPDCDVDLVAERPPEPTERPARAVSLSGDPALLGPSPVEIYIGPVVPTALMRAVLEGNGIPCAITGSGLEGAYPAVFPHRLFVAEHDVERANEIILAARTGELDLDEGADPDGTA